MFLYLDHNSRCWHFGKCEPMVGWRRERRRVRGLSTVTRACPSGEAAARRLPACDCLPNDLVSDCHFAVFSRDDLHACGLGCGIRVDRYTRLGRAVGAPGADVAAGPFGEAGAVRAVSDGAEAGAAFWCFEVLGGE